MISDSGCMYHTEEDREENESDADQEVLFPMDHREKQNSGNMEQYHLHI